MAQQKERGSNFGIYGLDETKDKDPQQWRAKEQEKVEGVVRKMGIAAKGEILVKFRVGKKRDKGDKPHPISQHSQRVLGKHALKCFETLKNGGN